MAKMKQIKTFEAIAVPRTIVKFKTYFYGTETDIHHPDCKLLVKLDIWMVEEGVPTKRFHQKQLNLQYIQRAVVDFEKREIHHKKHGKIEAANLPGGVRCSRRNVVGLGTHGQGKWRHHCCRNL